MKRTLIVIGILICIIIYPFRSIVIETLSATDAPIKEVKEGDVIFKHHYLNNHH